MHARGLLDDTLVVAMGEFGRTPQVGQITSSAGADKRRPRPLAVTATPSSSPAAACPPARSTAPATSTPPTPPATPSPPQDIAATIYQALGIPPDTEIRDPHIGRPYVLSTGTPIRALVG